MKKSMILIILAGLVQTGLAALIDADSVISSSEYTGRIAANVLNGVEMDDGGDPDNYAAWSMNSR